MARQSCWPSKIPFDFTSEPSLKEQRTPRTCLLHKQENKWGKLVFPPPQKKMVSFCFPTCNSKFNKIAVSKAQVIKVSFIKNVKDDKQKQNFYPLNYAPALFFSRSCGLNESFHSSKSEVGRLSIIAAAKNPPWSTLVHSSILFWKPHRNLG
jgi:hypothetical protein